MFHGIQTGRVYMLYGIKFIITTVNNKYFRLVRTPVKRCVDVDSS